MKISHERERVRDEPDRPTPYSYCKAVAEWNVSLVLLVLASPLLAGLAVLVKLTSRGPVFYSQIRLGKDGREYRVYKIRTMLHDCEGATGAVWAVQDDPRVTSVGRFLRETHLDELPQLWNVLRGEMSLIGPRPERPEIASQLERVVPSYRKRLQARPGLTGLAQLRLPADSDVSGVRRKLSHDLYYVRRVGPVLDLQLALSTVFYMGARLSRSLSDALVRAHGQRADRERHLGGIHQAMSIAGERSTAAGPVPELQLPLIDSARRGEESIDGVKAA